VTAGPTRAWIDPVRYIANASTGSLGSLIADRFAGAGAEVDYIAGPGACKPENRLVTIHEVETPADVMIRLETLAQSVSRAPFGLWVHAMAVLDFVPPLTNPKKINSEKECLTLHLVPTPKILRRFKFFFPNSLLVGFKLETTKDPEKLRCAARIQAAEAGCDLVVANAPPFQDPENHRAYFWDSRRAVWSGPILGKPAIAETLFEWAGKALVSNALP